MKFNSIQTIALFGTSADPPTIGHKKILEELSKIYSLTIAYASNNPKKQHKEDISIRSLLLKTLIDDLENPRIIYNQSISSKWAIESIKMCKDIYQIKNVDFVIGSDLVADIFSWKKFEEIIDEVNFFIIEREGYPVESKNLKILEKNRVKFKISTLNIPKISSSTARLNTKYTDLPKSLINIVKKNKLYSSKN